LTEYVRQELLADIVRVAQAATRTELMVGNQGNFSARDPATGYFAITPHDRPYVSMTTDDLVILDVQATVVAGHHQPSYDHVVHATVYRERPEVMAVVHTEPPYINVFGALGRAIVPVTTTGLKSSLGAVPIMPYRPVRDVAFAQEMLQLMGERLAVVWANHGLLLVGATIDQAYERSAAVEFNAKVLHLALQLGEPQTLEWIKDVGMVLA
jgi:L-ribulose-5-phosphate 4-epimerase